MYNTSQIELSKSALQENLQFIQGLIGDNCNITSVVKGNAYGHGIEQFVPLAESCGVTSFAVFDTSEAVRVSKCVSGKPGIMIMGMVEDMALEWCIENEIEFYVFDLHRLVLAIKAAKKVKKKALVHLELETGMNRTGIPRDQYKATLAIINDSASHLHLRGVCTHYAGAESIANYYRVQKQYKKFTYQVKWFENHGIKFDERHTACSAATVSFPKTRMDRVRIGILQYGFWPSKETFVGYLGRKKMAKDPLRRVLTWKTKIMDVKFVKAGEFVGYGTSFLAEMDTYVASVPVGYSHGYSRSLSNHGRALLRGARVSVIGLVNMNMLLLDVTHVPNASIGDEVVLIGDQDNLSISVASFGEMSNQLNYELLTRLPLDIPRLIVE